MGLYGKYDLIIAVDPGVHTGFCVWDPKAKRIVELTTTSIHRAMDKIKNYHLPESVLVRLEDARKAKWFFRNSHEKLLGAGAVMRDCTIWEAFLTDWDIPFELIAPRNNKTKLTDAAFKKITGYVGRTSYHSRDACMLCYGLV